MFLIGDIFSETHHDFSLPTQRCFFLTLYKAYKVGLFSAYAEVFPSTTVWIRTVSSFLCLRRGVSYAPATSFCEECFSLPTQRCFLVSLSNILSCPLFSAYAEVFLLGKDGFVRSVPFLCLRRGVSRSLPLLCGTDVFSLPTQRCFCI